MFAPSIDGRPVRWRFYAGLVLAAAAVLLPATLIKAALNSEPAPAHASLAGQLLIATPDAPDPRFRETVVLLVKHNHEGAFGIVINRPVGEIAISRILNLPGEKDAAIEGSVLIFAGGPVQPEQGFIVHSGEYRRAETVDIDGRVAVTSSPEVLRDIASGKGPNKKLVALGYSGWGPGQLEGELKRQFWVTAPADLQLIFDDDRAKVWDNAMARRPRDI